MEQKDLDEYWSIFNVAVKTATLFKQRKVALAYCELVADHLDSQGLKALNIIRELTKGNVSERRRVIWQKKMQGKILKDKPNPYSVLSWSLESDNPSYPPWYAAGIAGLNLVDLNIASTSDLKTLAKNVLSFPD